MIIVPRIHLVKYSLEGAINKLLVLKQPFIRHRLDLGTYFSLDVSYFFRLFPIISIPQKIFSIFFLTLEKIGINSQMGSNLFELVYTMDCQ